MKNTHHVSRRWVVAATTLAASTLVATALVVGSSGASTASSAAGLKYANQQVLKYSGKVTLSPVAKVAHPVSLKGKTVWYIPITNSVDSLAGMGTAMAGALSHLGAKVQVCDGGGLPTTVANCLTSAAQQGAAAVVTSYIDYEMAPTAFGALATAGIPVIVGNEPPDPGVTATKELKFTYGTAQTDLFAELMAFQTIALSKGHANVLVIRLTDSASTTAASDLEVSDFHKYCPGCTVNTLDMQTAAIAQLPSNLSAALVAAPTTNYVTVPTDAYLPPALGGIQSAGMTGKVSVVSADGGVAGLQDVVSKTIVADPGNPVQWVGWEYADAVLRVLSGDQVGPEPVGPTKVFTTKNLKGLKLNEANYQRLTWYGVSQSAFQAPFLKAWGVK